MTPTQDKAEATVKLVTEFRLLPGSETAFSAWLPRYVTALETSEGFFGRESTAPTPEDNAWTFTVLFNSLAAARAWQVSSSRAEVLAAIRPLLQEEGHSEVRLRNGNDHGASSVTEVILDRVQSGSEDAYREWSTRVQQAQAKFPGYQGGYTQRTSEDGLGWMTIMRFASVEDLQKWMRSPERAALVTKSSELVADSYQLQVDGSFPGWAPVDPDSGKAPPGWKFNMLVLLGLYPVVALEIAYLMSTMAGLQPALSGFIGNAISVVLVGSFITPYIARWMGWWLFPKPESAAPRVTWTGVALLLFLYAIEIALFWKIL
ncbi:hypothetical protein EON81_11135 [bacterium]|nr:MAG: hypothetical protein EON81_11135 [bacterium]